MRVLALDVGSKRIGLAISDALGITAQGLFAIPREANEKVIAKLKDIIKEKEIRELVVGLPLNMDGTYSASTKDAVSFADDLKKNLDMSVKLWDERLSTREVERLMIEADVSRGKRKRKIDKLAAQVILQSYLDSHRANTRD